MLRHAANAKIFLIVVAHFSSGVPPVLRSTSGCYFFTSPTAIEMPFLKVLAGTDKGNKNKLAEMFSAAQTLRNQAQTNPNLLFDWRGHPYQFKWGTKEDPGDGRLSLCMHAGESILYQTRNIVNCPECSYIGQGKVDPSNYNRNFKEAGQS